MLTGFSKRSPDLPKQFTGRPPLPGMPTYRNTSARDVAAIGLGMAAGILASRILPPLFASASGSIRARMGEDPFEPLINDHRKIMATLSEMEQCPTDARARRGTLFLALKRKLAKHAMAEEDVVYPMLQDQAGNAEQAKHLFSEHADMKITLFELENILKCGDDWSRHVNRLRNLIESHIREEEEEGFPALRHALSERRSRSLAGLIRREEAMVL